MNIFEGLNSVFLSSPVDLHNVRHAEVRLRNMNLQAEYPSAEESPDLVENYYVRIGSELGTRNLPN